VKYLTATAWPAPSGTTTTTRSLEADTPPTPRK
jgi:hypothetical protein